MSQKQNVKSNILIIVENNNCLMLMNLKAGLKKDIEYGSTHFTGMHLHDNAFFFSSSPEVVPDKLSIFEVKSILFKLLNVNIFS